ncbi:carboxypeptidase regulatory-like domain-containing protein [Streptomyces sp. NPDC001698]|uniref:carboxypeptidase regulatory-like domain-containing protein n=1 Tax=unclassified Streptomyces TaxID=2593676 RepID=UPI0036AB6ADB
MNQAVAQGAKYVSNSYGGGEDPSQARADEAYFHHPGVAITVSSGDYGYGVEYPAASPYVTSVGGTSLVKDASSRGWSETTWSGAGSGCSSFEPKPSFQKDTGCARRTVSDVSAVADPSTGVAVYYGGWHVFGGTSVSAPIIASVYALAGKPVATTQPNTYPYDSHSGLNDVTSGINGSCNPAYLCTAGEGYDGPTGLGTPNGVAAFRSGPHGFVSGTVTDGSGPLARAKISIGDNSIMTDGEGHYTLSVGVGTYDVTASKFGYGSKTVSGVTVDDGQTVTENFAMTAKPSVKITGKVRDGSGHGWPLYATVQVKDEPTTVIYTDPKTGQYSLSVPVGETYTLRTDALYPGYEQKSADVAVGSADVTRDVNVVVDQSTCSAAGYAYQDHGTTETFDGTTAPTGWTVDDPTGNGQTWVFDNPQKRANSTGGSGNFAIVDSDYYGPRNSQDTSLISPVTDMSGNANPSVSFASDYYRFGNQYGDVDVSVDGGQTWSNVWHHLVRVRGPRTERIDLPAAAGRSNVQVRFHFTATYGNYWEVDNVRLASRNCDPTPGGGLLVGQVLDKNTGEALNGASTTSADQPKAKATSVPTPDDLSLGDGFYWLFSSLTGNHKFTATPAGGHHSAQDIEVDVAPDAVTEGTFSLPAPRIAVDLESISKTVGWQSKSSQTVTVKNTGTAPVTAKIGEQAGTDQPAAQGAPLQKVKGHFTPGRIQPGTTGTTAARPAAAPSAAPWTAVADYPTAIMDNAAARSTARSTRSAATTVPPSSPRPTSMTPPPRRGVPSPT